MFVRKILKVTYKDHKKITMRISCSGRKLSDIVTERRFRMAGHVLHLGLPDYRAAKVAMSWT